MDKSAERLFTAFITALECVPKLLEQSKERNDLLKQQNELMGKTIATRQQLLRDAESATLGAQADEKAPDTKPGKAKAKTVEKAPEPEPEPLVEADERQEEEDDGLGEDKPKVTLQDIADFFKAETAKEASYATQVKGAFSAVRRAMIGVHEDGPQKGQPLPLPKLPEEKAGAFLAEFKRKIKALTE